MQPQIASEKTAFQKQSTIKSIRDIRRELTQKTRAPHPVIWAFEPTPEALENQVKFRDLIEIWKSPGQRVIPATVLSAFDSAWPLRLSRDVQRKLLDQAQRKLENALKQTKMFSSVAVQALPSNSLSMRRMAQILAKYAKRAKAEVLVVGSGAAHRSEALGIGSFAESLIAVSSVPVMVVSEAAQIPTKISKIFFPTDLSLSSKKLFAKVIKLAQNWDAEVILYHHFDLQMGPVMMGPMGVGVDTLWLNQVWEGQKQMTEDTGRRWERSANKSGVRCTFVADYQFGPLAERALALAKQANADLMIVGMKRGPLSQVIFGKTIRHFFAKSMCPVIVLRTQRLK